MPSFHGTPRGHVRPGVEAEHPGPDAGPHVDERMAGDEHVGAATLAARRDSFDPATRWSTRMPRRRCGDGANAGTAAGEVVDAVHRLDDDADVAQVVAPHVLEQLGVVAALDPDPARRGDPGRPALGRRPSPTR